MKKVNKNVWIIVGIIIIVAFIGMIFLLKKDKTKNEKKSELLDNKEAVSQADILYGKLDNTYFGEAVSLEEENGKKKVYKIDGKDYNKILNYEFIKYMFTDKGLLSYNNLMGIINKNEEYYQPVKELKRNETWESRDFSIVNQTENEIQFDMTSNYCVDENCVTKTNKKSSFVIKKVDEVWKIDIFEIDE